MGKDAVVTRTFTYEKKNRNFLLGKIFFESKVVADGERFYEAKLDTRATPYTMVWFHKPVRAFYPTPRDVTGQDEMTVSAWHTPDRKVVTRFGWEWAGVKKVYLDVVGNNPWMGDYKLSRQGEFEEVS